MEILSQQEINQVLSGDFFEEELDEKTVTNSVDEQSAKSKSKFGVNSSGKEITNFNPNGVHKPNIAPDGTSRDVKFTNRIMDNVIAGEKVEYPKTFARGIMDQNPGMFETIESENKGKVLLRPTDEFFSTTNIDRTGEYAKQQTEIQEKIKIDPKGSSDAEIRAALDEANNRKTKTEKIKQQEAMNAKVTENKKLIDINEKEMDSAIDDITKMYSSGTEKINVENINAGKSINNGNTGTGSTETGSGAKAGAEATEEVKPRQFGSPMEKIIAETQYGPAGKTMETSGVFTEDAGKYNLKNIAEMEAKVAIEAEKANKLQIDSTSTEDAVKGKGIFGGLFKKDVALVDSEFNFKSDVFKGGEVSGNYGRFEADAKPEDISKLENIRSSLNTAKNKILKESYVPASNGSDVHFEKGVFEKLNEMKLTEGTSVKKAGEAGKGASSGPGLYLKSLGLDDETKIEWGATEEGGLEGLYKRTTKKGVEESHKLKVNFGKDGAMSGFEAQKLDGDKWINNDSKIDLGNGQQVGIERAKEIAKMNEKQVRMDMINQNRQAVKDGVEGAKKMGVMEELKLKLGKGAKAEEAKTIIENAKTAVRMHTDATETMAKNIGGVLGDAGRVDLKAISAAASGAVEGTAKEAGKNLHAMGNNTGKGITSLVMLAGVGMAFGAIKATFDNSAEQRRQKQLELMAMRQQYGGAM